MEKFEQINSWLDKRLDKGMFNLTFDEKYQDSSVILSNYQIDAEELTAKLILEQNIFKPNTLLLSDRPDLRTKDGTIGIEVTNAMPTNLSERQRLWIKGVRHKLDQSHFEKLKCDMAEHGEEPSIVQVWNQSIELCDIQRIFDIKVDKLQNYKSLENEQLFIDISGFMNRDGSDIKLEQLKNLNKSNNKKSRYDTIYLLNCNTLTIFDCTTETIKVLDEAVMPPSRIARLLVLEYQDFYEKQKTSN